MCGFFSSLQCIQRQRRNNSQATVLRARLSWGIQGGKGPLPFRAQVALVQVSTGELAQRLFPCAKEAQDVQDALKAPVHDRTAGFL